MLGGGHNLDHLKWIRYERDMSKIVFTACIWGPIVRRFWDRASRSPGMVTQIAPDFSNQSQFRSSQSDKIWVRYEQNWIYCAIWADSRFGTQDSGLGTRYSVAMVTQIALDARSQSQFRSSQTDKISARYEQNSIYRAIWADSRFGTRDSVLGTRWPWSHR